MAHIFPFELLQSIVYETDDFATLMALCLASKTLSTLTTPHMLQLAIAQDTSRIRDPGFLVYGSPALFDTHISHDASSPKTRSGGKWDLGVAPRPGHTISNNPNRCEQEIRDAAPPVVLWAAAVQPPHLATMLLGRVQHLDPKHLWSMFLVPSTACRNHWPWSRAFAVGHALATPLHVAARHGNTQVVRWLLERQHLAVFAQSVLWPHLGQGLPNGGMEPINLPAVQPCVCPTHHLKVHFQDKPVPAPTDLPWASALHIALAHSHLETAKLLVDRGANWATGQHGTQGITALMIASANALLPFLDHLLDSDLAREEPSHYHPTEIDWQDAFSVSVKEYTLAVGSVPERRMLGRRLAALEARFSSSPTALGN